MYRPLVSIALCTYRGAQHLKVQLDSLLVQTYPHIEIIISDDCSTDGTRVLLEEYASREARIKVFYQEKNLGYVQNFEFAMTQCRGEYIALCDQDDYWYPQKIEELVNGIGSAWMIYHDSELVDEKGLPLNVRFTDRVRFVQGQGIEPFLMLNCVSAHAMMIRKELLAIASPFPTALFHDWWLAFAASAKGEIRYLSSVLVSYRQHSTNATDFFGQRAKKTDRENFDKMLSYLDIFRKATFLSQEDKRLTENLYQAYKTRLTHTFSYRLFFFLLFHLKLYALLPKSILSKINVARKESRGV